MHRRTKRRNKKSKKQNNLERKEKHSVWVPSEKKDIRFFDNVPKPVCAMVASYLPYQGHARFAETCKSFTQVCKLPSSWFSLTSSHNLNRNNIDKLTKAPFNLASVVFQGSFNAGSCEIIARDMKNLTSVDIATPPIDTIAILDEISKKSVQKLRLHDTGYVSPSFLFERIDNIGSLTDLSMVITFDTIGYVSRIGDMITLRRLELIAGNSRKMSMHIFTTSKSLSGLSHLRLREFTLELHEIECISKLHLLHLSLVNCELRNVPELPDTLEHLDLSGTSIYRPDISHRILDYRAKLATDDIMEQVVKKKIPLRKFGARGIEIFLFPGNKMRVRSLEYLDIWGTKVTKNIVKTIHDQFPGIKGVHVERAQHAVIMGSTLQDLDTPNYYDHKPNHNWLDEV